MFVADLLLGVGWVQDLVGGADLNFDPSGRVSFIDRNGSEMQFYVAHGQGIKSWASVSAKIRERTADLLPNQKARHVLVAGLRDGALSTPNDLIRNEPVDDLIRGPEFLLPVPLDASRTKYSSDPEGLRKAMNQ
jgi:hypothetical protein